MHMHLELLHSSAFFPFFLSLCSEDTNHVQVSSRQEILLFISLKSWFWSQASKFKRSRENAHTDLGSNPGPHNSYCDNSVYI